MDKNNRTGRNAMTLKEAAEHLGMTKPGIRHRMKVIGIPLEKDAFGRVELSEEVLQWIRDGKKPESTVESGEKQKEKAEIDPENIEKESEETGKNQKEPESGVTAALVELLREELKAKDKQIESLNAELAQTGKRLDSAIQAWGDARRDLAAAQALHAATAKQLQQLQEAQKTKEEPEPEEPETVTRAGEDPKPRKKTLWERITGKGR